MSRMGKPPLPRIGFTSMVAKGDPMRGLAGPLIGPRGLGPYDGNLCGASREVACAWWPFENHELFFAPLWAFTMAGTTCDLS